MSDNVHFIGQVYDACHNCVILPPINWPSKAHLNYNIFGGQLKSMAEIIDHIKKRKMLIFSTLPYVKVFVFPVCIRKYQNLKLIFFQDFDLNFQVYSFLPKNAAQKILADRGGEWRRRKHTGYVHCKI